MVFSDLKQLSHQQLKYLVSCNKDFLLQMFAGKVRLLCVNTKATVLQFSI